MKGVKITMSISRDNDKIIPRKTFIENGLPIKEISKLAKIEGNAKKPVYEIHKWWARRLSAVVRAMLVGALLPADASNEDFWHKFYSDNTDQYKNNVIMDIFMGGGTSVVEAKKMGFKTIGYDVDPLACFITKKELEKCDFSALNEGYNKLYENVGKKIKRLYLTEVQEKEYPIINVFWVYQTQCEKCGTTFDAHPHYYLNYNKKEQYVFCKQCGKIDKIEAGIRDYLCSDCNHTTSILDGTYKRGYCICPTCGNKFKVVNKINGATSLKMFALEYVKDSKRFFKKIDDTDMERYQDVCCNFESNDFQDIIPDCIIPRDNRTDLRPISHGYINYKDLFNARQLFALSILLQEILKIDNKSIREWFIICFSDCLASNNLLCNYAYGYRKLTPLFGIHAYTVPIRPVENNVWGSGSFGRGSFERVYSKMIRSKNYCEKSYENKLTESGKITKIFTNEKIKSIISSDPNSFYKRQSDSLIINHTSEQLSEVIDKSIDIILTDPPYYDNLHYSELADFYYQWIKNHIVSNDNDPIKTALFANNNEIECHRIYEKRLKTIFSECYKKLKDEGIVIFSYHHNKVEAWEALGVAIKESGFVISNVLPIRSEGQSAYHSSEMSIKWDSIIVMRKKEFDFYERNVSLNELLSRYIKKIQSMKLDMKDCDWLSFIRSVGVMFFSLSNDSSIKEILKSAESKL